MKAEEYYCCGSFCHILPIVVDYTKSSSVLPSYKNDGERSDPTNYCASAFILFGCFFYI